MSPSPGIRFEGLSAGYGSFTILHDLSLEVVPGEILALIGPNGAGKSTVIKSIFGLTQITSGEITLKDKKINGTPTHLMTRQGVSYVNQGRIVFDRLSVYDNLLLTAEIFPDAKKRLSAKWPSIAKRYPTLLAKKDLPAYALSGGEQQQLALSRALIQEPSFLLLDEPSLGLSPKLQDELFHNIASLRDEGIGVLLVEQNASRAIRIADRTLLLQGGKKVLEGGKEILTHPRIREIYLGGGTKETP